MISLSLLEKRMKALIIYSNSPEVKGKNGETAYKNPAEKEPTITPPAQQRLYIPILRSSSVAERQFCKDGQKNAQVAPPMTRNRNIKGTGENNIEK